MDHPPSIPCVLTNAILRDHRTQCKLPMTTPGDDQWPRRVQSGASHQSSVLWAQEGITVPHLLEGLLSCWQLADQVFVDALIKAYYRKYPLNKKETPTFTTHLCAALAKSHWLPHNPLTNSGVTGPATKQDYIGVPKISALTVPTASGTIKNTSTPTHHAATQPIKPIAKANALERSALKKSIYRALVKFFTCLPHIPLPSPTVPIAGQITVAHCNVPLNALRPLATMTVTLTCGWSASTDENVSLSLKAFPTSTLSMWPCQSCILSLESRLVTFLSHGGHQVMCWATGAGPCHHQSQCDFQPSKRVMSWCGWLACQRTAGACMWTQWWGQADFLRVD